MKADTMALTPRRRNVLCLRAAGYSQEQIATRLGITVGLVRKDNLAISRILLPGAPTTQRSSGTVYRLTYVLGLLDAGIDPDEVQHYLRALEDRVGMRLAQIDRDSANSASSGQ